MSHYKIDPKVMVGVPTLMGAPLSWQWMNAYMGLAFPLGCSVARSNPQNKEIGLARNIIVEEALMANAEYVLFISDDVIPPARTFEMLARHKKDIVTGVYWTKYQPTQPYLWKGMMNGPHNDWTFGEFFEIDWAGCDCLLIHTDVFRKMERPWFSTDWSYNEGELSLPLATEDLYFYTKAKKLGYKVYCDTAVQCGHQDRATGMVFGLTSDMPHAKRRDDWKLYEGKKNIADIGCGLDTPYFGKDTKVTRIDGDPSVRPDVLCDIRAIPLEKEQFDVVHSRHVLEHFFAEDIPKLIAEWTRILKIGGEFILTVPDLAYAAREILKADADPAYNAIYAYWQMYGRKQNFRPEELHKGGFTKNGLKKMFSHLDYFKDLKFEGTEDGVNITVRAIKSKSSDPYAILPNWYEGEEKGTASVGENGKIINPSNGKKRTKKLPKNVDA